MGGSNNGNGTTGIAPGVSGTLGTPATGNIPEGRYGAVSWTDSKGNLWLFGGGNYSGSQNYFNDLWEFNPSTNQWAWMSGSSPASCTSVNCGQSGVYGQLGVAAAGNVPGSRTFAQSWTDNHGNLWLFGGYGIDSGSKWGYLNDLWEFNSSTNQWTWMGGSSTLPSTSSSGEYGQPGVYGVIGIPTAGIFPGGRWGIRLGTTVWATSGYLVAMDSIRLATLLISMISGSSIPPPSNGLGWVATVPLLLTVPHRIPATLVSTARCRYLRRVTYQEADTLRLIGPTAKAIYGSLAEMAWIRQANLAI